MVLGAGDAGLPAEVKAKDLGVKDAIILEKAKKPGLRTWYSGEEAFSETQYTAEAHVANSSDAKLTMHFPGTGSSSRSRGCMHNLFGKILT